MVQRARQDGPYRSWSVHGVEQAGRDRGMHRVNEALQAVASPVNQFAGSPAGLTLDAVFEIDDNLKLAVRIAPGFEDVCRAYMLESGVSDGVFFLQNGGPVNVNVRGPGGLVSERAESLVPVLPSRWRIRRKL